MYAAVLIFGVYGNQKHLYALFMLDIHGFYKVPPAQGQEVSVPFLDGMGQGRHADGKANQLAFVVLHERYVPQVQQAQERIHVVVDDIGRHHGEVEEAVVGAVDEVEDLLAVFFLFHLFLGDLSHVQLVAGGYETGGAGYLFRELLRHKNTVFQPVVDFAHAQRLEVLAVIGVVVFEEEGGDVVESFHYAAFVVKVREAQRAGDLGHAILLAKGDDGLDEGLGNRFVVNEVYPAKAYFLVVPVPVGNLVDDGGDAAGYLSVFVGQEQSRFSVLAHGILGRVQGAHLIYVNVGNIVGAALVQLQGKLDESLQIFL